MVSYFGAFGPVQNPFGVQLGTGGAVGSSPQAAKRITPRISRYFVIRVSNGVRIDDTGFPVVQQPNRLPQLVPGVEP